MRSNNKIEIVKKEEIMIERMKQNENMQINTIQLLFLWCLKFNYLI